MVTYHGSCLCGDIAYEVSGDPVLKATCHCKSCQKGTYPTLASDVTNDVETGSAFASDVVFPANSIKFLLKTLPTTAQQKVSTRLSPAFATAEQNKSFRFQKSRLSETKVRASPV